MNEIVTLNNVDLIYQSVKHETQALKDINLTINEQEFISIVGPSGCGKTTILSLISGLIQPTNGEVKVMNKKPSPKDDISGYMFQRDNLLPWRNIENNIYFGLELKRKKTKEKKDYAISLAEKYGLAEFLKKHPSELSGGMRQRVALIRTLALKPELLLLDEPFSALDYQTRLQLCDDVYDIIKKEKKTAILVTHDLMEAITMSDRIIVLSSRPGTIKAVHKTKFNKNSTPFERRQMDECKILFDKIWQEIQNENQNKI